MPEELKYEPVAQESRIFQGEILEGIRQIGVTAPSVVGLYDAGEAELAFTDHNLAIVVSQDCDLEQDFRQVSAGLDPTARPLPNILLCELVVATSIRKPPDFNAERWKIATNNKNERYHFLEAAPRIADLSDAGIPAQGADFKRYFTVSTTELYEAISQGKVRRRTKLTVPYAEHFCYRFGSFLARIALPCDHDVDRDPDAPPALPSGARQV